MSDNLQKTGKTVKNDKLVRKFSGMFAHLSSSVSTGPTLSGVHQSNSHHADLMFTLNSLFLLILRLT